MNNPVPLIIIIAVLSCAAAAITLAVSSNRKKTAMKELKNAAKKLVKEQRLNDSLIEKKNRKTQERYRMIIALSWKENEKVSYVFDPSEGVRIGRQPEGNQVMIPDDEVSMQHCVFYRYGNDLLLEDLRSTNGTMVIHGFQKSWVRGRTKVYDGDRILIGNKQMLVNVFWIDSAFL